MITSHKPVPGLGLLHSELHHDHQSVGEAEHYLSAAVLCETHPQTDPQEHIPTVIGSQLVTYNSSPKGS